MSDLAISVENVGKRYRLGQREPYKALRDIIMSAASAPLRLMRRGAAERLQEASHIWALRNVSLEIPRGQVVGLIGRNGAGKTTLLKVLSRITEPTEGRAVVNGRVGSLLEVGTGFHPELTGGENIFLNGAILGMKRAEIIRKFDDIVNFAELSEFVDTPVKRYSTGMFMRLAFSVAAFLETEILMVDEVLAVGDAAFQQKSLGKMGEVARSGRTVLFVSHNMATISSLCSYVYVVDQGGIAASGDPKDAIEKYLNLLREPYSIPLRDRGNREGDGTVRFTGIDISGGSGAPVGMVMSGQDVEIRLSYEAADQKPLRNVIVSMPLMDMFGQLSFVPSNYYTGQVLDLLPPKGQIVCRIPRMPLYPGKYDYNLQIRVNGDQIADWLVPAGELTVVNGDFYGSGKIPESSHRSFLIPHEWKVVGE